MDGWASTRASSCAWELPVRTQRECDTKEKEHRARQDMLSKQMESLDVNLKKKKELLAQIEQSDAKLNAAHQQVYSLKDQVLQLQRP